MKKKLKLGICCPIYNEKENIANFYDAYSKLCIKIQKKYDLFFLFSDNNSNDGSFEIVENLSKNNNNIYALKYSKNYGVMKSIYTAIVESPDDWDLLAVFDCDLQDPPELLIKLIKEFEKGNPIVCGKRINRDEPKIISLSRRVYNKLDYLFSKKTDKPESGAWLLSKNIINHIKKQQLYKEHLPSLISELGFNPKFINYERAKRNKGKTKFNYFSYLSYAVDGIIGSSITPLRISIFVGILFGILSIILSLYFIVAKFYLEINFQEGIAAMIVLVLINFSINFFFLGIIGEYVGRIFNKDQINMTALIEKKIKPKRY